MDRSLLKFLLSSGPSRKWDVATAGRALDPGLRDTSKLLFKTRELNRSILLKHRDPAEAGKRTAMLRVPTMVYMPYDDQAPSEGGESFFFSINGFQRYFTAQGVDESKIDGLRADMKVLQAISEVPTLSPYLVSEHLARRGIAVPPGYFNLPEELAGGMYARMRRKLTPLIEMAFAATPAKIPLALDEFTQLVLDANDRTGLLPLGAALQLHPDQMMETFSAWTGITYFEEEFDQLRGKVDRLGDWIGANPYPRCKMLPEQKARYIEQAGEMEAGLQADWQQASSVFAEYRSTWEGMVNGGQISPFVKFMSNAASRYWRLGDTLGRMEQLCLLLDVMQQRSKDGVLPQPLYDDFSEIARKAFALALVQASPSPSQAA